MRKEHITLVCKSCGNSFEVPPWKSKGHTTNCKDCRERHHMANTRLYHIWENMKQRCYNTKNTNYHLYGALNITIDDSWRDNFICFYAWAIENCYEDTLSIDRVDGTKGYSPSNCRWVSQDVQARNIKQLAKNNTTGYKGVYIKQDGRAKKYCARITVNYKEVNLGSYYSLEDAAKAYNKYIIDNELEHTLNTLKD